jgi:outer membrane biosynthesis protein TonB
LFRRFSAIIAIVVLTTLIARPSFSDDVTINLDQSTPFVDVPVTVTEPVDAVIQTITGTPQTNPGFIDSWIEVWQGLNKLAANDDGAHSATNVLASIISMPLTAGEYFIRATSFAWIASNGTQFPTGSYLLSTNLTVATPSPSPTVTEPTPEPSPSPTETVTPTPSPSETSTLQPSPEPSPTPSETQSQPENLPDQESSPEVQPSPTFLPDELVVEDQESVAPVEPDVSEQLVEDLTFNDDLSLVDEVPEELEYFAQNDLLSLPESVQQIFESISTALESIPGGEQVLAAAQFVNNLGSELTPEERREAQQVVLGAIIVSQLANPRRVK